MLYPPVPHQRANPKPDPNPNPDQVAVIEQHVDTLVSWLMHDSGFVAVQALEALDRMGAEKLASLQLKGKIASAPVASSSKRQDRSAREQFLSVLAQLPE